MFTNRPTLTNIGKTMLLKAVSGEEGFEFDGFAVGDGILEEGETLNDRLDLKHKVLDNIAITSVTRDQETNTVQLTGEFTNENGILEDLPWRELGLYAHGEDNVKKLYAYAYEEEYSELIPASGSAVLTKQTIIVTVSIGDTDNITVHVKLPDATYAMADDFDEHVQDNDNPHSVTYEQTGAAAATHEHSTNDITSGILPVERGGTGMNNFDQFLSRISNNFAAGTFMGNGATRKDIYLGFKPSAVVVFPISGGISSPSGEYFLQFAEGLNQYHSGCGDGYLRASADNLFARGHGGAAVTATGFAVGYGYGRTDINITNQLYAYIAFK